MEGIQINDDMRLSAEADAMGARAAGMLFDRKVVGPIPPNSKFKVVKIDPTAGRKSVTLAMANRFPKVHVTVDHKDLHKLFKKVIG